MSGRSGQDSDTSAPLKGLAKVQVRVLDANDSPLQLPDRLPQVKMSRSSRPGSYVATVRANDVDARDRPVVYTIVPPSTNQNEAEIFTVEKFTGQVFVADKGLLASGSVDVTIQASDGVHTGLASNPFFYFCFLFVKKIVDLPGDGK